MAIAFKCSICGGEAVMNPGTISCKHCGIISDLNTHKAILSNAPEYVQESVDVMNFIRNSKPMFCFSAHQLFDKNFKTAECVFYRSPTPIWQHTPEVMISYNGMFSKFLKEALLNYVTTGYMNETVLTEAAVSSMLPLLLTSVDEKTIRSISYAQVQLLTALMAPTWFDCAMALMDNMPKTAESWTASQLLYSYMICNKLSFIRDTSMPGATDTIKEFIKMNAKFVHEKNDNLSFHSSVMKDSRAIQAMYKSIPELYLINSDVPNSDNVAFLFGIHDRAAEPVSSSDSSFKQVEAVANGLHLLWMRYGEPISYAKKKLKNMPDETYLGRYIKFWEDVREKLK